MKKIRINELARELEVKAHEILDKLPELGVQDKKTHSSSIDDDVADKLRVAFGHEPLGPQEESPNSARTTKRMLPPSTTPAPRLPRSRRKHTPRRRPRPRRQRPLRRPKKKP